MIVAQLRYGSTAALAAEATAEAKSDNEIFVTLPFASVKMINCELVTVVTVVTSPSVFVVAISLEFMVVNY